MMFGKPVPRRSMNIHNIANQANVDRSRDRASDVGAEKTVLIPTPARDGEQDQATISSKSRDAMAAVELLAERARGHSGDRSDKVEAALLRLQNGELGSASVLEETARRLGDSGFLAG